MSPIIEARGVTYRSGTRTLLSDVLLSVRVGTFTVIVGPNGAGKSTLLRVLSGELAPSHGEVLLNGRPLREVAAWRLAHSRAVMPQASELSFAFSALEVARLGVEGIGQGLTHRNRHQLACEALDHADAAHLADRNYQTLSGGERQRIHFARVLAQLAAGRTIATQQVLLLDEPIANLDLKHQLAVLDKARHLCRDGLALVAVLHDLQFAASIADELVLLQEGRILAKGKPRAVLTPARLAEVFGVSLVSEDLPRLPWTLVSDRQTAA